MLEKTKLILSFSAVKGVLRRNRLSAEKRRLPDDKGIQLRLITSGFEGVSINDDTGTVLVQGTTGKPRDALVTLLLACMVVRDLKKKAKENMEG